jgi:hypothetical protein
LRPENFEVLYICDIRPMSCDETQTLGVFLSSVILFICFNSTEDRIVLYNKSINEISDGIIVRARDNLAVGETAYLLAK